MRLPQAFDATRRPWRLAAAGVLFLIVALQVTALTRQSLVWDEPYHLVAGQQALCGGTNTLNLEHPPWIKLVGALPLGCLDDTPALLPDRALAAADQLFTHPDLVRRATWSRVLVWLVSGLPFLVLCHLLGNALGGSRVGFFSTALTGLCFCVLPFLGLVLTDAAVALGYLAVAWTGLRYVEVPTGRRLVGLGLAFGVALAAKHSGVLVAPAVWLAPAVAARVGTLGARRRAWTDPVLASLLAGLVLLATYALANWNYNPALGRASLDQYLKGEATLVTGDRLEVWRGPVMAVERWSPGVAQWTVGFLGIRAQDAVGIYPSFAFGRVSSQGRWWYFPAVLGIKVSWVLLLSTLLAVVAGARRRDDTAAESLVTPTPVLLWLASIPLLYLLVAMTSNYNLGTRHLLPVLPFLFLPAARFAARRRLVGRVAVALLAVEAIALAPLWMSATNAWFLGPLDPFETELSDSNFEYGQNLVTLRSELEALEARGIGEDVDVRVVHPVLDPAELHAYLPTARLAEPGAAVTPGWYAVGRILDQYDRALRDHGFGAEVYQGDAYAALVESYGPLLESLRDRGVDRGEIAGTFRLVEVPQSSP